MIGHEHNPEDIDRLRRVFVTADCLVDALEDPDPTTTLADTVERLTILSDLLTSTAQVVRRMKLQLVAPYAAWEDQHANWQRAQGVES